MSGIYPTCYVMTYCWSSRVGEFGHIAWVVASVSIGAAGCVETVRPVPLVGLVSSVRALCFPCLDPWVALTDRLGAYARLHQLVNFGLRHPFWWCEACHLDSCGRSPWTALILCPVASALLSLPCSLPGCTVLTAVGSLVVSQVWFLCVVVSAHLHVQFRAFSWYALDR